MHKPQQQVRDFHRATKQPCPEDPIIDWKESQGRCRNLIVEEVAEFIEALEKRNQYDAIQEACDILYVVYGWFVTMGVDAEPYFEEVHRANMTKVSGPKREDGKQLKPDNFEPADMRYVSARTYKHTKLEEMYYVLD